MVSVVIPVYNAEPYIGRCIESVLSQSYSDVEIVAVDDGSSDGSLGIVERYMASHPNVHVIRHDHNLGLMATRRDGYAAASGDWIMFLDADDALPSDAVAELVGRQHETDADIVLGDLLKLYVSGRAERRVGSMAGSAANIEVLAALVDGKIIHSLCGKLFKAELFRNGQLQTFRHLTIAEDGCLLYQLVAKACTIASVDAVVYYYYENKSSSSLCVYGIQQIESMVMAYKTIAGVCMPYLRLRDGLRRRLTREMFALYFERVSVREIRLLLRKHGLLRYGSAVYACRYLRWHDYWFFVKRFVYVRTVRRG